MTETASVDVDQIPPFFLRNDFYQSCNNQKWRLCCSMKVTCFSYCIPAALWMLPALVTVFLLHYESYLLQLLYSCHDDKHPNAKYISLETYKAWHLHNWLIEGHLTPLLGLISGLVKTRCWGERDSMASILPDCECQKGDLLSESFHDHPET